MTREELIEKMRETYIVAEPFMDTSFKGMAAALDVAVGELLKNAEPDCVYSRSLIAARRSRYLKPKIDPAVEAVGELIYPNAKHNGGLNDGMKDYCQRITDAVRNADKEASNG